MAAAADLACIWLRQAAEPQNLGVHAECAATPHDALTAELPI
jgi:hypothetical protein